MIRANLNMCYTVAGVVVAAATIISSLILFLCSAFARAELKVFHKRKIAFRRVQKRQELSTKIEKKNNAEKRLSVFVCNETA